MTTVSVMRGPSLSKRSRGAVLGKKGCDYIVEKALPERGGAYARRIHREPATQLCSLQLCIHGGLWQPGAGGEIRDGETGVQAQRIEHEFEGKLMRGQRIIAADPARRT